MQWKDPHEGAIGHALGTTFSPQVISKDGQKSSVMYAETQEGNGKDCHKLGLPGSHLDFNPGNS